jgi:hypothetical protein
MAFLELLSGQSPHIDLPLSGSASLRLDASPVLVTVPVTTAIRDAMSEDADEQDVSTLGNLNPEEE